MIVIGLIVLFMVLILQTMKTLIVKHRDKIESHDLVG